MYRSIFTKGLQYNFFQNALFINFEKTYIAIIWKSSDFVNRIWRKYVK